MMVAANLVTKNLCQTVDEIYLNCIFQNKDMPNDTYWQTMLRMSCTGMVSRRSVASCARCTYRGSVELRHTACTGTTYDSPRAYYACAHVESPQSAS